MELIMNLTEINNQINQTCVLNQYALVEATNKLPKIALWLSLVIFLILAINYIVLPFLTKWKYYELAKEALPGCAFAVSIWLPLILMYFTLDLTEVGFKKLETILLIVTIAIAVFSIYWNRRIIIDKIKSLKEETQ